MQPMEEDAAACNNGLPEPLWDEILSSVGVEECHLRPISTMSSQLLSATNHLKKSLHITTNNKHCLPMLFKRFPNTKHINLPFFIDPVTFFGEISKSEISLESLDLSLMKKFPVKNLKELTLPTTTLRSLKLSYIEDQTDVDGDLEILTDLFPNLEELELFWMYQASNNAISKLKRLRKIKIIGNSFVTDSAIESLMKNCPNLEDITLHKCPSITSEGVYSIFRHCKSLRSLTLQEWHDIGHGGPISLSRNLTSLEFSSMPVSDDLLRAIGRANLPLKSLSLTNCKRFTFEGIAPLLGAYRSILEHFSIQYTLAKRQLKAESIIYFAPYLQNVKTLKLNYCCSHLSPRQLLVLINTCRSLNTLELKGAEIIDQDLVFFRKSESESQIRSLNLTLVRDLNNQSLAMVSLACPHLEHVFLNGCKEITHKGVAFLIRSCHGLRTLEINGCPEVVNILLDEEVEAYKLEVLEARGTCIDDDDLRMIAMKCPDLRYLDVTDCRYVTTSGIFQVAKKCRNLARMRVTLKNVDPDDEFWIRSKKPWLFDQIV